MTWCFVTPSRINKARRGGAQQESLTSAHGLYYFGIVRTLTRLCFRSPSRRADRNRAERFAAPAGGYTKPSKPKWLKIRYVNQIQAFLAKQTQASYLTCYQLDTAKIRPFFDENECSRPIKDLGTKER